MIRNEAKVCILAIFVTIKMQHVLAGVWFVRIARMLLPLAFPDARHVDLVPAEHVKLIIIEHTGSVVQDIRKILCHWSKKEKKRHNIC